MRIVIGKATSTFIEINTGSLAIFAAIRWASSLEFACAAFSFASCASRAEPGRVDHAHAPRVNAQFEGLLQRLGLGEQTQAKTTRYAGSEMLEHVIKGQGNELAFSPITEILLYRGKGLQLVGPLPAEIQNFTTYAAEPAVGSEVALAFVRFLGTPAAKAIFVAAGVE
jgi:Bacterial extracellular solute-binding protein